MSPKPKQEKSVRFSNQNAPHPRGGFPIVGIGASAGGLEAFSELLAALPLETDMAFVLVQHLAPKHESWLSGLLSRETRLPVLEATHGLTVRVDHVYVIPPNATLTITDGILQLTPRDSVGPHLPIDVFFRSLADDQGPLAMGVILSGTGTDGTLGLEAIRSAGGITFVQSEASAKFAGMPHSVIEGGGADLILSPPQIAQALVRMGGHPGIRRGGQEIAPSEKEHYGRIVASVSGHSGVDFSTYRDTTIRRRIMRRMMLQAKESFGDYADMLDATPDEVEALYNDILINVTAFFRDPQVFKSLTAEVFPEIMKNRKADSPVRIWVPGCSTGQEAYSLAMALLEFMEKQGQHVPIQIFATDLDLAALQRGREGIYPENIETEVSAERLKRFFTLENGKYRINKELRDICTFAKQNVAADPPFSRMDLISCRNLLIYLSISLQRRVIPTFHYSLKPGGYLLLGSAETVGVYSDMFDVVNQDLRVYIKKLTPTRQYPHFGRLPFKADNSERPAAPTTTPAPSDWIREADRALLRHYVPPGVLINDTFDILQFRGRTTPYLEPAPGEPSHNLLRMASAPLFSAIRSAVEECKTTGQETIRPTVRIRKKTEMYDATVRVLPVQQSGHAELCFIVLFEPEDSLHTQQKSQPDIDELARLQQELVSAHEYLQTVIEQKDLACEELRSANEEVLSSNEELQSTNEELETAKEELQSVNEELTTVNEQLQHRNRELNHLNDDMLNLLVSADLPILVIGSDFQITRTTPKADKVLNLAGNGFPRMVSSLHSEISLPNIEQMLTSVITFGQLQEHEVQTRDNRWWQLRIHPYRTAKGKIAAAVIVLLDIDEIRRARQNLRDARDYALSIIETVRDPLIVLDADLRLQTANDAFYKMFKLDKTHTQGSFFYEMAKGIFDIPELRHLLEGVLPEKGALNDFEMSLPAKNEHARILLLNARRILHQGGVAPIFLLAIEDITDRKEIEKDLRDSALELGEAARCKDEFLAMLAHELRNPLAPIGNALQTLTGEKVRPEILAEAHDIMQRHVTQLVRLIDDLLDVSRIANGKIDLHLEAMDLKVAVQGAVETSAALVEAGQHVLTVDVPPEPLWIKADPARMMQILGNLLNNAAKYTPPHGKISLSAMKEGQEAVIRIRDNGIGIPADMLDKIFEMFSQIDTSVERAQGGLGIGLMLVKSLLALQHGSVFAASAGLGKGSEFTVRLPLTAKPRGEKKVADAPKVRASRLRIMVVDDNKASAKTMSWMLEMLGHEVQVTYDGPHALAMAKNFLPDAILLDIGLPGMSGYDLCRKLRREPSLKSAVVIAQTGWGDREHRRLSKEAGFDFHLVKPVRLEDLQGLLPAGTQEKRN